jgi:hypothetical protein
MSNVFLIVKGRPLLQHSSFCTRISLPDVGQHVRLKQAVKGKGPPQQAEVAQGVPGRFKAPDFLDIWHYEGGRLSALCTGRLYPRRNLWYSFLEAESTPGHMVLSVLRKKSPVTPPGIDPETARLVAQCLNHHATLETSSRK